jgi:hypothetical protein
VDVTGLRWQAGCNPWCTQRSKRLAVAGVGSAQSGLRTHRRPVPALTKVLRSTDEPRSRNAQKCAQSAGYDAGFSLIDRTHNIRDDFRRLGSADVPHSRERGERSVQAIPSARNEDVRYRFFFFFPPFFGMSSSVGLLTTLGAATRRVRVR